MVRNVGGRGGSGYGFFPSSYVTFIHPLKSSPFMPSSRGAGGGARGGRPAGGDMSRKQFLAELDELKKQSQSEAALTQSLLSTIQTLTSQLHQYKSTFISLVPSADFSSSSSSSPSSSSSAVNADEVHNLYAEFNQMRSDVEGMERSNGELNAQLSELTAMLNSTNSSISSLKQDNVALRSSLKSLASTFESISKSPITVTVGSPNNNNNLPPSNLGGGGGGGGGSDGGGDDSPLGSLPKANILLSRPISKPRPLSRTTTPTRTTPSPNPGHNNSNI
jgi:cell fate (sporulation/competence/biofilm development) regulator YlbF (YheA/YmcA/DUF963 family)